MHYLYRVWKSTSLQGSYSSFSKEKLPQNQHNPRNSKTINFYCRESRCDYMRERFRHSFMLPKKNFSHFNFTSTLLLSSEQNERPSQHFVLTPCKRLSSQLCMCSISFLASSNFLLNLVSSLPLNRNAKL